MKHIYFFLVMLTSLQVFAQSDKLLDNFTQAGNYYYAFVEGAGSVNCAISTSQFSMDNTSLEISYSFNNTNTSSFFQVVRNYNTVTQDYAYMPVSISLDVKRGQQNDQIALRLWEDNNMDGAYNGTDEVWICLPKQTLSGLGVWETKSFDFASFVLLTGSGDATLNLNRIRAWDLAIYNGTGTQHTSTMYVDNLRFHSAYTKPAANGAVINGVFFQLWNTAGCACGLWTQQQWETEMQKMKEVGVNKVIIQYSVYNDLSWYSPTSLSYVVYKETTLNKIFAAAEKLNMKVMPGLYFDETWNSSDKASQSTYTTILNKHKSVIDELYALFGSSPAFDGFYIPQEINDLEWQTSNKSSLLYNFIQNVCAYAHAKNPAIKTMISPFFNLWQPSDVVADWYDAMLAVTVDLDLVIPQDGVGVTIKDVDTDLPNYFSKIKQVCDDHSVGFGVNAENFEQLSGWPIDNNPVTFTSATISRLVEQLQEAKSHNPSEIISFEWSYMQSGLNAAATQLYADYKNYITTTDVSSTINIPSRTIYPTIVDDYLTLTNVSITNTAEVQIINHVGQVVYYQPLTNAALQTIDVSYLSSGLYFLKFQADNATSVAKFIKQ